MERSKDINELVAALARAQGKYKPVKRSGKNPKFKSKYATLDDVITAVRKALSSEALAYTQLVGSDEAGYYLTTILAHESGQFFSEVVRIVPESLVSKAGNKVRNDLQELGNALAYIKRYSLASMFGVNSEIDDDGNASGQQGNGKQKQTSSPQSAQAKAAQEEKTRTETALNSIKDAWIQKAKEVGLLGETPTSAEWEALIQIMGPTYQIFKSGKKPEAGFDKLKQAGLEIIVANAPEPEPEQTVETAAEVEAQAEPPDRDQPSDDDVPPEAR